MQGNVAGGCVPVELKDSHTVNFFRTLSDTTGREYANYVSAVESGVAPGRDHTLLCEFILRSGEVFECRSSGEFDTIAKEYLQ